MFPEIMVVPMREELTRLGIEELRTAGMLIVSCRVIRGQPWSW